MKDNAINSGQELEGLVTANKDDEGDTAVQQLYGKVGGRDGATVHEK